MLFTFGKGIGVAPADHFEIGKDVLAGGFSGFIAPHLSDEFNPGQMMPLPAMTHSVGRLAGKLVQPQMHLGIRFAKFLLRFGAMLLEGGHFKSLHYNYTMSLAIRRIAGN